MFIWAMFINLKQNIMEKLIEIQSKLKAPKNQRNNFGNYNYRSCEDILEAVKPILGDSLLTLTDEIVEVCNRVYVKATATFFSDGQTHSVSAFAREAETKKGMDESQITGSASSYARKYALNGLFLIDDNKDADTMKPPKPILKQNTEQWQNAVKFLRDGGDKSKLDKYEISDSDKLKLFADAEV